VKQRILIIVLEKDPGEDLIRSAAELLQNGSIDEYLQSFITTDQAIFFSEHLDVWSMGDSFDRFLRPKKHVRTISAGSRELYAIPRERLRLGLSARNEEEDLLRDLLGHAKRLYRRVAPDAHLFLLRSVTGASGPPISRVSPIDLRAFRE
jgi:hypothetical protein